MPLSEALEAFYSSMFSERSPKTITWYQRTLKNFTKYFDPAHPVESITTADLRRWRELAFNATTERGGPPAHTTRSGYIRAVRRLFGWLVEEGIIEQSPAARLRYPRRKDQPPKAIANQDFARLFWQVNQTAGQFHYRDVALVLLLLGTGARVGGVCRLTVESLDLENGKAWVVEKGERGRWVFLDPPVVEAVRLYLEHERPNQPGPLFWGQRGPLTIQGIWWVLKRHARAAGISGPVNPHAFRHAFAKTHLENGDNLSSVSELLGHASIKTTHEHYARWSSDQLQEQHRKYSPLADLPVEAVRGKIDSPTR